MVALVLRLALLGYNLYLNPQFAIQQDNYASFAQAWRQGTLATGGISHFDTRLFPGYPALIGLLHLVLPISEVSIGVIISLVTSLLAIYFFWLWSKDWLATWLFAIFPPVWVLSATKVATEPLSLALILGGLLTWGRKHYLLTGLLLGYACTMRNIAAFLVIVLGWQLLSQRNWKSLVTFGLGVAIPGIGLLVFNGMTFGWNHLLYQIEVYNNELDTGIGLVQLVKDVLRTIDWGQYRILISGLLYVGWVIGGWWGLLKYRQENQRMTMAFWWTTLSLIFLFTLSMPTFLEDFGRYAVPIVPPLLLGWVTLLKKKYGTLLR